jgi:hypothetical protein
MDRRIVLAFAALVAAQAVHSVEEFVYRLYDVFAPARAVSRLVAIDPGVGFAISNSALLLFGLFCLAGPVRRGRRSAPVLLWGWAIVELANGCGHLGLAAAAGGYFPGLYSAPLLVAAAGLLIAAMTRPFGRSGAGRG